MPLVRAVIVTLAVLAAVLTAPPAGATDDLASAKARANRAAAELASARTRLAEVEQELSQLEAEAAATAARLTTLEQAVTAMAVEQFMHGNQRVAAAFDPDLGRAAKAEALARYVSVGSEDAIDQYRAVSDDLAITRAGMARTRAEAEEATEAMKRQAESAFAELRRLEQLEAERKAREEAARRARLERERRAARSQRPTAARPAAPSARAVTVQGDWTCPVQGPRSFTNDWGQPRSGGRRHQGNDILAPRGTPVVASVSGVVRPHQSSMGGISYYLSGDDGITYFGTHLDSLSGASGRVAQGTVLGYVGNTGNARGGPPHLHFEMHPGGGAAVNPYPTLARYC